MSELNPAYEDLARGMLQEDIVKFGKFTLKSGKTSLAYVNLRDMISVPRLFDQATNAYADTLIHRSGMLFKADGSKRHLAAIPEAAMYYGGAVGRAVGAPMLQHRVKAKEYGQPRAIEGRFIEGDECVLLDDVITSAESKIEEAAALESAGLTVVGAVILVDREQGGRTIFEAEGFELASAMTLSGIAKYALQENLAGVTQTMHDELMGELDPREVALY